MRTIEEILSDIHAKRPSFIEANMDFSDQSNITHLDSLAKIISEISFEGISFSRSKLNLFPWQNEKAKQGLATLFHALSAKKAKISINLSSNELGAAPEVCEIIFPYLMQDGPTKINLTNNHLAKLGHNLLKFFIYDNKENLTLLHLDLTDNALGELPEEVISRLGLMFARYKNLQHLALDYNNLVASDFSSTARGESLIKMFGDLHSVPLRFLGLARNDLGNLYFKLNEDQMKYVITCLTTHPMLSVLNLAANDLFEWEIPTLQRLLQAIIQNHQLKRVDIESNTFSVLNMPEIDMDCIPLFIDFLNKAYKNQLIVQWGEGNFTLEERKQIASQLPPDIMLGNSNFFSKKISTQGEQATGILLEAIAKALTETPEVQEKLFPYINSPLFDSSILSHRLAEILLSEQSLAVLRRK